MKTAAPTLAPPRRPLRLSLLPAALILVLLALVLLLPKREGSGAADGAFLVPGSAAAGRDVAEALLSLPALDLTEPPAWALQRGTDPLLRRLDRVAWGGPQALERARASLAEQPGALAAPVLARLDALGDGDPILVSKLVAVLGDADPEAPGVVPELTRRALSESPLIARAALRALAGLTTPAALGGILMRRGDDLMEVRREARAALAKRASSGDDEALLYVLDDVEQSPADPDLAYLAALGRVEPEDRVISALHAVVDQAPYEVGMVALGALLVHDDAQARERIEQMIRSDDPIARLNGLRAAQIAQAVVARDQWDTIVRSKRRQEVLAVMSILRAAIATGDRDAPHAAELLESIASDPRHPCQVEALDLLVAQGHPWAVERTRQELMQGVGAWLGQTVDRVITSAGRLAPQFAEVALERLAQPDVDDVDRVLLCRLLAHVDPAGSADLIVSQAMDGDELVAQQMIPLVAALGQPGLDRLQEELESDRGAALFVYLAANDRGAACLPGLRAIALDEERDLAVRSQAFDCIARLEAGPREDALRSIALQVDDPAWRERARLLFWNYL